MAAMVWWRGCECGGVAVAVALAAMMGYGVVVWLWLWVPCEAGGDWPSRFSGDWRSGDDAGSWKQSKVGEIKSLSGSAVC